MSKLVDPKKVDDYQPATDNLPRSSMTTNKSAVAEDPDELNFSQLRKDYQDNTAKKMQLWNSSFVHYCKNPYNYAKEFGGNDTVITMEICAAPNAVKFKKLEKRLNAEERAMLDEIAEGKKAEESEEEMRHESQEDNDISSVQSSPQNIDQDLSCENGGDLSCSDGSQLSDPHASEKESDGLGCGQDRIYNSDMFNQKREKVRRIELVPRKEDEKYPGIKSKCEQSTESVCISIWKIGGMKLRYSRMASLILQYAPKPEDQRFYCSHSADAIYYLTVNEDTRGIVVINLADFKWQLFDFSREDLPCIKSLENSSLVQDNNVLVFQDLSKKTEHDLSGDFWAYDLYTLKEVWYGKNVEAVFFSGKTAHSYPDKDDENGGKNLKEDINEKQIKDRNSRTLSPKKIEDGENEHPEKIIVLTLQVVEKQDEEEAKAEKGDDKKKEKKKGEDVGEQKENELVYEFWKIAEFQKEFKGKGKRAWHLKQSTTLPLAHILKAAETEKITQTSVTPKQLEDLKPKVIYANDCRCDEIVMISMGTKMGTEIQPHKVYQFGKGKKLPSKTSQRPGNCTVQINQNTFLREADHIFLFLTTRKGETSAKALASATSEEDTKLPILPMKFAEENCTKDVWVIDHQDEEEESQNENSDSDDSSSSSEESQNENSDSDDSSSSSEDEDEIAIQSICMSSMGDFLNCASISLSKASEYTTKVKAQELNVAYPCMGSNIGTRLINIQSIFHTDTLYQFELDSDFICWTNYKSLEDIGFRDKRTNILKNCIPQNETGAYIAFLTKEQKGTCEDKTCEIGDIFLNILHIDMFASPMTFFHWRTEYEACMNFGSRDDSIQKSFVFQVNSSQGVHVTMVNQYNDAIIFDCITAKIQRSISFPFNIGAERGEIVELADRSFQMLAICQDATVVPVPMLMDQCNDIYFLLGDKNNQVKVVRVNSDAEMGDDDFFQVVYTFQSKWVYFFLNTEEVENTFYLMDDSRRVRVLKKNPKTHMLELKATLYLCDVDKETLVQLSFDEFAITPGVLHWRNMYYTLIDMKTRDNPTWYGQEVSLPNYNYLQGPKRATNSGLIYYVEEQKSLKLCQSGENQEEQKSLKLCQSGENQGKHWVVLRPKADLSFTQCLPMSQENNNNFFSFISPDRVLTQYGGRFLVFDKHAQFCGEVQFDLPKNISKDDFKSKFKLELFCEQKQYFVFEGPEIKDPFFDDEKEQDQEVAKQAAPARKYYVFKFRQAEGRWWDGAVPYRMFYRELQIPPVPESMRDRTTNNVTPVGLFEQVEITECKKSDDGKSYTYKVTVRSAMSTQPADSNEVGDSGLMKSSATTASATNAKTHPTYKFSFSSKNVEEHEKQIAAGLAALTNAGKNKKYDSSRDEVRFAKRRNNLHKVWKFGSYLIAKCGSDLKFLNVDDNKGNQEELNFSPGGQVRLYRVYPTSVQQLLQFYLVNDSEKQIFVITWNMELNREHSLFQTRYKAGQFPEQLMLQSFCGLQQNESASHITNFNFMLEDGCIINLEDNVPVQFFDKENECDLIPNGPLKNTVFGQKKMSQDRQYYLDILKPGRIQMFISLSDLVYWERFQNDKQNHELTRGRVSSFAPVSRFPDGISIFHFYATNIQVLQTFSNAYELEKQAKVDDKRFSLFPLIFLHQHPIPNKLQQRKSPLEIAIEKQSLSCFDIMLQMVCNQTTVCKTRNVLGRIKEIIDIPSPAVIDLFSSGFRITDQLDGPKFLVWNGEETELFIDVPTAYITNETLQKLVVDAQKQEGQEENKEDEEPENNESMQKAKVIEGFTQYDEKIIEKQLPTGDDLTNKKQVEAKLLDFDWVFTADNSSILINILAKTENDEIFSCDQIRVFVEFMWKYYYQEISKKLFFPYVVYFLSFVLYASTWTADASNGVGYDFIIKWGCLGIWIGLFLYFLEKEVDQFRDKPADYFTCFWNILDIASMVLCCALVACDLTSLLSVSKCNVIGAVAVLFLWMKLFYWLRIYKQFSSFIRMISEIVYDIRIFSVMLILCLAAFSNCIIILQNNRETTANADLDPIFDPYTGWEPADAMIHAYLTGLGDFNKDYYSESNKIFMWLFFLIATVIVQLIFMNMLIALMGSSYEKISGILQQATLKELCVMMNDNIGLLKIGERFKDKRYILWLTPGSGQSGGTLVERQIAQLRNIVEDRALQSDTSNQRQLSGLNDKLSNIIEMCEQITDEEDMPIRFFAEILNERVSRVEQKLDKTRKNTEESNKNMQAMVNKIGKKLKVEEANEE